MEIREINYYRYTSDEVIGICSICGGDKVDAPEMAHALDLTESQMLDLELGLWTITYCPNCQKVYIYITPV